MSHAVGVYRCAILEGLGTLDKGRSRPSGYIGYMIFNVAIRRDEVYEPLGAPCKVEAMCGLG